MKRRMVIALAAALACPLAVAAQERPSTLGHIKVSPFLGYAFAYTQSGTVTFTDAMGNYEGQYKRVVEGGWMPGAEVEIHFPGRFGLSGAVAYNKRGEETLRTELVDVPIASHGSKMYFARAALTLDLRESDPGMQVTHPYAHLSVGPAILREEPDALTGRSPYNAFAMNGAANAEMPLPWKGFAVRVALEDYMAYLPRGDVAMALATSLSTQSAGNFAAEVTGGPTHLYVLRAGLTFHMF